MCFKVMVEQSLLILFYMIIFTNNGIHHQFVLSAQKGHAERKHLHITETGLTMEFHASVPLCYLVEAFVASV